MTPVSRWRTDWRVLVLVGFAATLLSGPDSFRGAPSLRATVRESPPAMPLDFGSRPPEGLGEIVVRLAAVDDLVAVALAEGKLPGCVVVVGQHDRVLLHKAYGMRALGP